MNTKLLKIHNKNDLSKVSRLLSNYILYNKNNQKIGIFKTLAEIAQFLSISKPAVLNYTHKHKFRQKYYIIKQQYEITKSKLQIPENFHEIKIEDLYNFKDFFKNIKNYKFRYFIDKNTYEFYLLKKDKFNYVFHKIKVSFHNKVYPRIRLFGKSNIYCHQLIMYIFNGKVPKGMEIDHIDRNKDNFNLVNLRYVTHQENCLNRKNKGRTSPNKSKVLSTETKQKMAAARKAYWEKKHVEMCNKD